MKMELQQNGKLYRMTGKAANVILPSGEKAVFKDGWLFTTDSDVTTYMDREIKRKGFGSAIWEATESEREEYAQYVDPATRRVSDIVAQLASNPVMAAQVAAALSDVGGEGAQALAAAINSGAESTVKRSITVGGKQHELGGISSSRTIASISNGSTSEDAPPAPVVAVPSK